MAFACDAPEERPGRACESTPLVTVSVPSTCVAVKSILCSIEINLSGGICRARFQSGSSTRVPECGTMLGFVGKNIVGKIGRLLKYNIVV